MTLKDTNYFKLIEACRNGNLRDVKKYLTHNYINDSEKDIEYYIDNKKYYYKQTTPLLLESLLSKQKEISIYLLENGADPNIIIKSNSDINTDTTLLIQLLISEADYWTSGGFEEFFHDEIYNDETGEINDDTEKYFKLMEKALADTSFIELLINYGADVNKPDGGGYTPLDACTNLYCDHITGSKLLKKLGAKHSQRYINKGYKNISNHDHFLVTEYIDKNLPTSHRAIEQSKSWGKNEDSKYRIGFLDNKEEKNDLNELDWKNRTPLDYAKEIGHIQAVEYLEKVGAIPFINMSKIFIEIRKTIRQCISGYTQEPELGELTKLIMENNINEVESLGFSPLDLTRKEFYVNDFRKYVVHKKAEKLLLENEAKTAKELI